MVTHAYKILDYKSDPCLIQGQVILVGEYSFTKISAFLGVGTWAEICDLSTKWV